MEKSLGRYSCPEAAYVMINCKMGYELSIAEELKNLSGVKEVECISGNYDVIAKIEVESVDSLRDIITFKIRRMEGVGSTTTLLCIGSTIQLINQ